MRILQHLFGQHAHDALAERAARSSEEHLDIVTDVPHWIVRGGMAILSFFLVLGLSVAWFLRYPDVVQTQVVLTTVQEPVKLNARVAGRVAEVRHEGDLVEAGSLVAYIETPTDPFAVVALEGRLRSLSGEDPRRPEVRARLSEIGSGAPAFGSLQPDIETFVGAVQALEEFYVIPALARQIAGFKSQALESERLRARLERQRALIAREVTLAEQALRNSHRLSEGGLLSSADRDAVEAHVLQQQRNLESAEAALISNEIEIRTLEQRIVDLQMARLSEERRAVLAVTNALNDLQSRIQVWKDSHLFTAPEAGVVTYHRFRHQSVFVPAGSLVLSIVPQEGLVMGQIKLPAREFGKVKLGQPVRIDLDTYPAREFGYVEGRVADISPLPLEGMFRIDVELVEGLATPRQPVIEFRHEMTASGIIVTEDASLLQRVFYQFRWLWNS
jgi:multidrug resistance efflux pump